ncbi:hypothetical protein RB195_008804 [Necator americanus]|uniref:Uncharacterized protein n=1 Tax=Necator americanus TaxID=51031 RepID=A0ABR1CS89_NECAM
MLRPRRGFVRRSLPKCFHAEVTFEERFIAGMCSLEIIKIGCVVRDVDAVEHMQYDQLQTKRLFDFTPLKVAAL